MKNIISWKILSVFAIAIFLFAACQKEDPIKLEPKIATWQISDITSTSAKVSGLVIAEGDGFTEHGVAYAVTENPTVDDNAVTVDKIEKAVYTASLTNLEFLTTYHVRAYTKSTSGNVLYGKDTTFTTLANVPFVNIADITNITATSATGGGEVTNDGKSAVTARGLCWSMEPTPTIENDTTLDGTGVGAFTSNITGLIGGITYYVRAYAINEIGITYTDEKQFTTLAGLAVVTSDSIKDVTKVSATVYGNVAYTGGADVTEKGICWSTNMNPTIADNTVADGTGTGLITGNLTGLTAGTTYHARAYAINSEGTSYGEDIVFETIGEFFLVGSINGWNNHGLYTEYNEGNIFLSYQYLTSSDEFKFFPVRDSWNNGWGRDGTTPGTCILGGGNIKVSDEAGFAGDGFYQIKFDATNKTVEISLITTMGVIGTAQAGGWDTDVNLTFNTTSKVWEGTVTFLASGEYKFRANDDWAINFGGTLDNLVTGAGNIVTPGAGTYTVTLDISGVDKWTATVVP